MFFFLWREGVEALQDCLFEVAFERISRGLLQKHKLLFAMRLAEIKLTLSKESAREEEEEEEETLKLKDVESATEWVGSVLGNLLQKPEFDLGEIEANESRCDAPLMLCSQPGHDASGKVDAIAEALGKTLLTTTMGSAEGFDLADKYVSSASKDGRWVLLRNIHLCPTYMTQMEKTLHSLSPHKDFRIFFTAEVNENIPLNLLRMSHTFVYEAPAGMKAGLMRLFSRPKHQHPPAERERLHFLLAWLHATFVERLTYAPVGWTKQYEFSEADQRCAKMAIDHWIDHVAKGRMHVAPEEIPWEAIHTMLSQSIYGGRIDNEFDQELLESFVRRIFAPESFDAEVKLSDAAPVLSFDGIDEWIQALPSTNSPAWLGLPPSAEELLREKRAKELAENLAILNSC